MESNAAHDLSVLEGPDRPEWAPKDLSGPQLLMCEYHMAGMTCQEIGTILGYHKVHVGVVLRSPAARKYIASRVEDLDAELHSQYHKVVRNISQSLDDESVDVKLKATEMWLKTHGKFARAGSEGSGGGRVSAEEVVQKLLEHASSVNINIDNRQVHNHSSESPSTLGGPDGSDLDDYSFLEGGK